MKRNYQSMAWSDTNYISRTPRSEIKMAQSFKSMDVGTPAAPDVLKPRLETINFFFKFIKHFAT